MGKCFRGAWTGPTTEPLLGFCISPVVAGRVPDHFSPTLPPTALALSCCHHSETTTEPPLLLPLPAPRALSISLLPCPSPSCLSQLPPPFSAPSCHFPGSSCLSDAHCCQSPWQSQLCWARGKFWTPPCSPAGTCACSQPLLQLQITAGSSALVSLLV